MRCEKYAMRADLIGPEVPLVSGTSCDIKKKMSPDGAVELFNNLSVPSQELGHPSFKVKLVGRLLVVYERDSGDNNSSRAFMDHPCQKNTSLAEAKGCMEFWARNVEVGYEEDNYPLTFKNSERLKVDGSERLD